MERICFYQEPKWLLDIVGDVRSSLCAGPTPIFPLKVTPKYSTGNHSVHSVDTAFSWSDLLSNVAKLKKEDMNSVAVFGVCVGVSFRVRKPLLCSKYQIQGSVLRYGSEEKSNTLILLGDCQWYSRTKQALSLLDLSHSLSALSTLTRRDNTGFLLCQRRLLLLDACVGKKRVQGGICGWKPIMGEREEKATVGNHHFWKWLVSEPGTSFNKCSLTDWY